MKLFGLNAPAARLPLALASLLAMGAAVARRMGLKVAEARPDLGGGYFTGVAPTLQWSSWAALTYGALGVLAALVGGWWPAPPG